MAKVVLECGIDRGVGKVLLSRSEEDHEGTVENSEIARTEKIVASLISAEFQS